MKKITVILLVVSLMLCSAFVACSKAPCETHTYVDGKCSVCEIECEHASFEDGACKECGKTCSHVGGTATCTEKKECTTCGAKYGEKIQQITLAKKNGKRQHINTVRFGHVVMSLL